jgi:hypothetical protein
MALLAGCPKPPEAVVDAAVADAGIAEPVDAGPAPVIDAGPPLPAELIFEIDFLQTDGGVTTVHSSAGRAEIEPSKNVMIQFPVALKDFRVRMFDGAEQVLPSDEEAELQDAGMSYRIALAAPLKPGRSYSFGVEAQLGHEITDVSGHGYKDVLVALKVRGEPEPEPNKPGKKHHKR